MDLSDITKFADEQDSGRWFELRNPVDGSGTGIKLLIVGPDSKRQRDISISLQKALLKAQDKRGQIDPQRSEEIYADHIAQYVIDLDATEDGQPVPYSHEAILSIVRNGRRWAAPQIGKFAETRRPYSLPTIDAPDMPVMNYSGEGISFDSESADGSPTQESGA